MIRYVATKPNNEKGRETEISTILMREKDRFRTSVRSINERATLRLLLSEKEKAKLHLLFSSLCVQLF